MCEKNEAEALQERLCRKNEHFMKAHGDELAAADAFCEGYKAFCSMPRPSANATPR